ncbi:MAG: family 1 glycosylhydrolase [Bifidobacteriaceae bacterium]|jgi:beta-glucosidase|nr:family 1 glycosylhydrolase [Bifidobacteriaceae bacterium]
MPADRADGFPPDFIWGAATASYQIEGAVAQDGRGTSIWDTFSHTAGKTFNGDTGDVACDHYNRWEEDLDNLKELGVQAYRFSIAWPRVQPDGSGPVNRRGLDFYSRLVDGLLDRDIRPVATLYHWDLPQALEDRGGWPSRDTAYRFADYAAMATEALGNRVDLYTTLNEPWCAAFLGYASGVHAPGVSDAAAAIAAAHHLNLGHGLAAQAVRAAVAGARVSLTLNLHVIRAASDSEADQDAARQIRAVGNEVFLGPALDGDYPADLRSDLAAITDFGFVRDGDLAQIRQPLDCLGVNYYSSSVVRRRSPGASSDGRDPGSGNGGHGGGNPWVGAHDVEFLPPTGPLTAMGWNIDPPALTELLVGIAERYPGLDLMVTENGSAFRDTLGVDGRVHDPQRIAYLDQHVEAVAQAIRQGAPVRGYFAWSLMDNFEWACGYDRRFGLLHVDYANGLERRWKDSAHRFQSLVAGNP